MARMKKHWTYAPSHDLGGFVPVGDLALDLPVTHVLTRRDDSLQPRHNFTQLD